MKKFKIENPNNYNLDVICLKTTSSETAVSHNHNHSHSGVYEGEKKMVKCMVLVHILTLMELNM